MKRTLLLLASSALCAGVFSSCSKTETKTRANVLMVHAAPTIAAVKITTDETAPYTSDFAFGMNTGYVSIESGKRIIKMKISDTGYLSTATDLEANQNYSIFLMDTGSKLTNMVLKDDLSAPAGNQARMRFIHLSPNAIPVDVIVTKNEDTVFKNKPFKDVSDFTVFNPGVYNMHIRRHGTPDTLCFIPTFTLSAGKIYTLYLKGFDSTSGKLGASSSLIQHN